MISFNPTPSIYTAAPAAPARPQTPAPAQDKAPETIAPIFTPSSSAVTGAAVDNAKQNLALAITGGDAKPGPEQPGTLKPGPGMDGEPKPGPVLAAEPKPAPVEGGEAKPAPEQPGTLKPGPGLDGEPKPGPVSPSEPKPGPGPDPVPVSPEQRKAIEDFRRQQLIWETEEKIKEIMFPPPPSRR